MLNMTVEKGIHCTFIMIKSSKNIQYFLARARISMKTRELRMHFIVFEYGIIFLSFIQERGLSN